MFNTPRALGGFPILALHPKSLRQIGSPWFFRNELRKRVRTSHVGGSFCVGNRQRLTLAYVEYASTLCFACATFLAPKSLRQIGSPAVFSERTPEAYANLSCGRFVLCGERITVDSRVCRIRFDPLFRLRHVFSSKIIAPNREPRGFFRTNSGSVCEPLMWEVRFVWGTDNG